MFGEKARCSTCQKEIKGNDVVYVRMRYPSYKGMTEIKSFLKNEGAFICEKCFRNN